MEMKIENIPSYRIAYIRRVGQYGDENMRVMEGIKEFAIAQNLFDDESIILGITQDNPQDTPPENCRYDACLVIEDDIEINDEYIKTGKIVGGEYVVFTIEHTVEGVQRAWSQIFPLLFNQGYKIDSSKPIIERYINRIVKNHKCEICVPID